MQVLLNASLQIIRIDKTPSLRGVAGCPYQSGHHGTCSLRHDTLQKPEIKHGFQIAVYVIADTWYGTHGTLKLNVVD